MAKQQKKSRTEGLSGKYGVIPFHEGDRLECVVVALIRGRARSPLGNDGHAIEEVIRFGVGGRIRVKVLDREKFSDRFAAVFDDYHTAVLYAAGFARYAGQPVAA